MPLLYVRGPRGRVGSVMVGFRVSGLPHRRSSRGHNCESAKPTRSCLPKICITFSFSVTLHSRSHCNTVTHMTRSQRTCYPPQSKRATSATQGQGGTTCRTPFSAHRDHNKSECSQSPGSEAPCDPTKAPLNKADIPTSRNCSGKPTPTQ